MKRLILFVLPLIILSACHDSVPLKGNFNKNLTPAKPDYSSPKYWASLPTKSDAADSIPYQSNLTNEQGSAKADVFFIYPTIYTSAPKGKSVWNADVNDEVLNSRIQLTTVLNQASVFNGSCRIYVPYYRQAHLYAFYTSDKTSARQALDVAYEDVKDAFQYYLDHYNHGRPIIIASHSQGSYHAERLVKDFFDGKELRHQLVAAYLVGFPIKRDAFTSIQPSEAPDEIGVWASWNTFSRKHFPDRYDEYFKNALSTNPLLWNSSERFAPKEMNHGAVGLHFTFAAQMVDAQNHNGILWINKPYVKARWCILATTWHRADMNFFYMNIRENVATRIATFLQTESLIAGGNDVSVQFATK